MNKYPHPLASVVLILHALLGLGNLLLADVALRRHLPKHRHGIKEDFDLIELQLVVDNGDGNALDIDRASMRLDRDLFSLAARIVR